MSSSKTLLARFPEAGFVFLLLACARVMASRSNLEFHDFWLLLLPSTVLGFVWLHYARRGETKLSDLAYYPLMLFLCGTTGMVLSYLIVDPSLPAYDATLTKLDAALFFHWPDWMDFQRAHPWYSATLQAAYDSWGIQLYGSTFFFALTGRQSRNRELLRLAIVSSALTLILFHSFPALGPFFQFSVGPKLEHLLHLPYLRAGAPLALAPLDLQGLISFPSFHSVMAAVFVYVHRGEGWLSRAVLALNVVMLLGTIVCGAHYLVDILGGLVVAGTSIGLVRMMSITPRKLPQASLARLPSKRATTGPAKP